MKMTNQDWEEIDHFSPTENWGNAYKMDKNIIYLLEYLRIVFQHPFIIHCGYANSGHSSNSQHYKGKAVDFHIKMSYKKAVDLMLQILETGGSNLLTVGDVRGLFPDFFSERGQDELVANLVGLGIYPHWHN